jgi:hypothetical protein
MLNVIEGSPFLVNSECSFVLFLAIKRKKYSEMPLQQILVDMKICSLKLKIARKKNDENI